YVVARLESTTIFSDFVQIIGNSGNPPKLPFLVAQPSHPVFTPHSALRVPHQNSCDYPRIPLRPHRNPLQINLCISSISAPLSQKERACVRRTRRSNGRPTGALITRPNRSSY